MRIAFYTWGWRLPLPPHPVDEWPYTGDMLHIITCIYTDTNTNINTNRNKNTNTNKDKDKNINANINRVQVC